MGQKDKRGLLEIITEEVGCDYLSNLREPVFYSKIKKVVETIEESDYTLKEWQDAADYITGSGGNEGTSTEVKHILLRSLNAKR